MCFQTQNTIQVKLLYHSFKSILCVAFCIAVKFLFHVYCKCLQNSELTAYRCWTLQESSMHFTTQLKYWFSFYLLVNFNYIQKMKTLFIDDRIDPVLSVVISQPLT